MTNFSISSQLPIFLSASGSGLNDGEVYIGMPNQDPQTFPKTVYWDEAGTDPVDQTNGIPTIGGYITRAGNPATVYIDGAYSIRVLDRFGGLVYYLPDVAEVGELEQLLASPSGASLVGFLQAGTGAVARTLESKGRDIVSVKDFGATGSVGADTAAWQSVLNIGGEITAPAPTYSVNTPLAIKSGTNLDLYAAMELRQAAGNNNNLLTNAAYLAPWVNVSGQVSWSTGEYEAQITVLGGLVLIGDPGVGDAVWLDGAVQPQYNGVFDVIEVVDASNIKVRLKRLPLASPTGTLRVKKADKDIVIDARGATFDYNETQNNDSTPGPQTHTIVLAGIRNLRIIGPDFLDTKKFAICLVAVSQFRIEGAQGWGLNSDMIKLYGPIWDGVVENIRGTPGDDFVSIQPHEPTAFSAYQIGAGGDCLNITLRSLQCQGSTSPIASLYPSAYGLIDTILIDDVTGYTTLPAIQVFDYDGGSSMGEVTVRRMNAIAQRAFNVSAATGVVTVRHVDIEIGPRFRNETGADIVVVEASGVVDRIRIKTEIDTTEIGAGALLNLDGGARVLDFEGRYKVSAAFYFAGAGGASLEKVNFTDCDIEVSTALFRGEAGIYTQHPVISFNGGKYKAGEIVTLSASATLSFNGARLNPGTVVLSASGGSASDINLDTTGSRLTSGDWASATGSAMVSPRSTDIVLNLNAAWITRKTGNFVTTVAPTGGGGATDIQAGAMALCQGTAVGSWQQMNDAVRVY